MLTAGRVRYIRTDRNTTASPVANRRIFVRSNVVFFFFFFLNFDPYFLLYAANYIFFLKFIVLYIVTIETFQKVENERAISLKL